MAIPTNHFHSTSATTANQRTGYAAEGRWAPKDWFTSIEEPATGATDAAASTVTTDHTFTVGGKGFLKIYFLPNSINSDSETTGEEGAIFNMWKIKGFIPGDSAALQTMIEKSLINKEVIILAQDITCPDGGWRQFGCDCNPAIATSVKFTSGTKNGGTKGYEVEFTSTCRYFYEGDITMAA